MESVNNVTIFITAANLSLLDDAYIFADGNFSYSPAHFYQIYSLLVYFNRFDVSIIIFVFMDSKSQEVYTIV